MNNTKINAQFIEDFGETEKLLSEIYSDIHGVSCYIDDMIKKQDKNNIKDWDKYLKRLKEIRHKRNKLAHGEVAFSQKYVLKEDIVFLKEFKKLILKKQDPINKYNKINISKQDKRKQKNESSISWSTTLLITLIIILICLVACVIYNFNH